MSRWVQPDDAQEGEPPQPRVAHHAPRVAVLLAVAVLTYALFPASPAADFALLETGAVAPDNVIAPFAFVVPKSEEELARERAEMARAVEPIFVFDAAALDSSRVTLARVVAAARQAAAVPGEAARVGAMQRAAEPLGLRLTPEEAAYLLLPNRAEVMADAVRRASDRWTAGGVAATGALDGLRGPVVIRRGTVDRSLPADSVPTLALVLPRARMLNPEPASPASEMVLTKLLTASFRPTLVHDRAASERTRLQLVRSIRADKYTVLPGEKIIGAHEVVGPAAYEKMRALRDEMQTHGGAASSAARVAGSILFNTLVLAVFWIALLLFRPQLYASMRAVVLFGVLFALVVAAAALVARAPAAAHPELIPVAIVAVLVGLLFDPRISMIAAIILAALIGGQSEFRGTNALFVNLLGGAAAALSVRAIRRRNQTYYSMLAVAAAYLLAAAAIGLTLDRSLEEIAHSAGWGALNAAVSVSLAMVLLPPAEEFARVDTYFKLLEWADLDRPLMRRLSLEAPGTFAHTIAIANLAESACNAIGANGLLARVGAYYHDIGKLGKPQYFAENQARGRNPHDALPPQASAVIIRDHVHEGMALAAEHRVPSSVRAFIAEHHGTGQIAYFAHKARERDGVAPTSAEFSYPGPVPRSAETAVVMLADGVEAATRVLADPTPEKLREVIDRIVAQRLEQGQLREAPLTLRQLTTVKEQFQRALMGMYHNRIDYPAAIGGVTSEFARA